MAPNKSTGDLTIGRGREDLLAITDVLAFASAILSVYSPGRVCPALTGGLFGRLDCVTGKAFGHRCKRRRSRFEAESTKSGCLALELEVKCDHVDLQPYLLQRPLAFAGLLSAFSIRSEVGSGRVPIRLWEFDTP